MPICLSQPEYAHFRDIHTAVAGAGVCFSCATIYQYTHAARHIYSYSNTAFLSTSIGTHTYSSSVVHTYLSAQKNTRHEAQHVVLVHFRLYVVQYATCSYIYNKKRQTDRIYFYFDVHGSFLFLNTYTLLWFDDHSPRFDIKS